MYIAAQHSLKITKTLQKYVNLIRNFTLRIGINYIEMGVNKICIFLVRKDNYGVLVKWLEQNVREYD